MEEEVIRDLFITTEFDKNFGTIRLAKWPEGIVLYVGGMIMWRSWKDPNFHFIVEDGR